MEELEKLAGQVRGLGIFLLIINIMGSILLLIDPNTTFGSVASTVVLFVFLVKAIKLADNALFEAEVARHKRIRKLG